eukprot:Transcript_5696.p1 GENE.Transcript_5696~~Transcript_5696.p1  ORF type:complete len:294 (+),score=109.68 Transcript_5696:1308-2189(+)
MVLASDPEAQLALLQKVTLPLLAAFTQRLRSRVTQLSLAASNEDRPWPSLGSLLAATAHCAPVLCEWADTEPLAALLPREAPAAESADPFAAGGGAFGAVLAEWREIEAEIEAHSHDAAAAAFASAARRYLSERRAFRAAAAAPALSHDLTPAFCAPLASLRADLSALQAYYPLQSGRRVVQRIGAALDELLYTGLLRGTACSEAGGQQLAHDMAALVRLFAPFAAKPHALLRRVHEAALLLRLPRARRAALLAEVSAAGGAAAAEAAPPPPLLATLEEAAARPWTIQAARPA